MTIVESLLLLLALELYAGAITWRFYKSAGMPAWAAFVPFYNTYLLTQIIQRPFWWTALFYVPVVGNVMAMVAVYELFHVFKYDKIRHTIFTILTGGLYMASFTYGSQPLKKVDRNLKTIRQNVSELASSLIFAVVAATLIRAFTFEAFTIPTPSMEKSLMVGDFLFVSKMQYGSRLPITPLAIPLVHNRVPIMNSPSFLDWIQLPYARLPKLGDVEVLDPVVFNYPMEDDKPIDKREHYVKRCLATPGDSLKIVDGVVFINNKELELPDRAIPQFSYYVVSSNKLDPSVLKNKYDINYVTDRKMQNNGVYGAVDPQNVRSKKNPYYEYIIHIPTKHLEEFSSQSDILKTIRLNEEMNINDTPMDIPDGLKRAYLKAKSDQKDERPSLNRLFPNPLYKGKLVNNWTRDNYGPIYMPKAGDSVKIGPQNFHQFERIIDIYENNDLEIKGSKYFVNGKALDYYTFKQDYYWMMGDNRHNSLDSRYWGYVPGDHIVGKPVFIWMSYDKHAKGMAKLRFDRIFTTVNGDGKRFSYFWPFVIVVIGITIFNTIRRKRKGDKKAA